jgi:D-alanine-D-alanine ligase
MKKINLGIIFGGRSAEHEVSLASALSVINNLDKSKYNIIPIAITKMGNWLIGSKGQAYIEKFKALAGKESAISQNDSQSLVTIKNEQNSLNNFFEGELNEKIDLILPILHGPYGEDGRLQGFLDTVGVPFIFSGHLALAIAMNKPMTKIIAKNFGVPVLKDITIKKNGIFDLDEIIKELNLPIMVKPSELGSSVGITKVNTREELEKGIKDCFQYGDIILENFLKAREFTVTIVEDPEPQAWAITEIIPLISEFYDYKAKYEDGGSKHIIPAEIPKEIENKMKDYAIQVFEAIGCRTLARADFFWDEINNKIFFNEINTIPGMTPTSLVPEAAKYKGYSYSQFLDKIINNYLKK